MSQENVEIVRAGFDAWNTGNMDALRELYDPDVVLRTAEGWPEPGPYLGPERVMRFFEQLRDTWDADGLELISDFIDVGDRVAVRVIWRGSGHGPESNIELTSINTVRKGRILGVDYFWDHGEALEALGLSHQDTNSEGGLAVMRMWSDSWNRGDIETFANLYDHDAVLITDPSWIEAGPIKGKAAIRAWFEGLTESWEGDSIVLKELFHAGETVVARIDWQVRGRASGIEQNLDATGLNRIENGKILTQQWYFDHAKALEAVGLSKEDARHTFR